MKKISIIIPVFNEQETIRTVLERVWTSDTLGLQKEILVVEGQSTDGTPEIIRSFARSKACQGQDRIEILYLRKGRGKGRALREGFARATGEILLIQDADLEYDVKDYPALLQPLVDNDATFVLGSRYLGRGWRIRRFETAPARALFLNVGGVFFHFLFNLLFRTRLSDPTTMYKVFRRECIEGLCFVSNRFDFDYELVAKLIRAGHRPLEVPVSYRARGFNEGKKVRVWADPLTWIWAILRFRLCRP